MNVRIETSNEIDYGDALNQTSVIVAAWTAQEQSLQRYHSIAFAILPLHQVLHLLVSLSSN
jgi:hypothetical protein